MPKYRVDGLISLPAAMAANGVDSSMHNQPCAIMLFTAFYNYLPRRASPAGRRQAKFQEIRRTQQTLSRMQATARHSECAAVKDV